MIKNDIDQQPDGKRSIQLRSHGYFQPTYWICNGWMQSSAATSYLGMLLWLLSRSEQERWKQITWMRLRMMTDYDGINERVMALTKNGLPLWIWHWNIQVNSRSNYFPSWMKTFMTAATKDAMTQLSLLFYEIHPYIIQFAMLPLYSIVLLW